MDQAWEEFDESERNLPFKNTIGSADYEKPKAARIPHTG
jgi:hypothetical protein